MPLYLTALLLSLDLAALVVSAILLRRKKAARMTAIILCAGFAAALSVHIADLLLADIWPNCWAPLPEIQ